MDLIDTAEAYGPEINERQVAEALVRYPPRSVVATKCGIGIDRRARDWSQTRTKGSPSEIRASCEGSLRRLRSEKDRPYTSCTASTPQYLSKSRLEHSLTFSARARCGTSACQRSAYSTWGVLNRSPCSRPFRTATTSLIVSTKQSSAIAR
jgi:hypothetical protein